MQIPSTSPLWELPVLHPPPGVKSDFNRPAHAGKSLIILNGIWLTLMILTVCIRLVSRQLISRKKFGIDDALCIIATAGSIVHSALLFHGVNIGYGRHMWDIRLLSLTRPRLLQLSVVETIYIVIIYVVKLSILALFYRLFKISKSSRILVYCGVVLCTIITVPFFAVAVAKNVRCTSTSAMTDPICLSTTTSLTNTICGAMNVVSDFYILVIPIRQLRGLNMERSKKFGLVALFMAGFVACAMSIIRLGYLAHEYGSRDQFYSVALVSHFTTVEINLGIMCNCMVFFPSFARRGKSNAESAFRYLLSKTGKSQSQMQLPDSDNRPPPSHSMEWRKFQPPTDFELELENFDDGGAMLHKSKHSQSAS